jgi:hypothetical protein
MLGQLQGFAEDRYLHQTGCLDGERRFRLVEDLPLLLNNGEPVTDTRWCIHFHVPIYLREFGRLQTSQDEILECLQVLGRSDDGFWTGHAEVETYAWGVLPPELRAADLAAGIAEELAWLNRILSIEVNPKGRLT